MIQSNPQATSTPDAAAPASPATATISDYYRALFQQVRAGLDLTSGSGRSVGVTSCLIGEGVTTICQNLVVAAAQQLGRPALLIDTNFTSAHDPAAGPGIYDLLSGRVEPADCIRAAAERDAYILSAGSRVTRGALPFPKEAFVELLDDLKREFPFVVVDLPTVSELTDCPAISCLLDGVLLVVEAERVRSQVVARARDQLLQAGARLLGVIFNKRRNHVPDWLYRRL
jgi:Mrp family chromosome partitioning ATPase